MSRKKKFVKNQITVILAVIVIVAAAIVIPVLIATGDNEDIPAFAETEAVSAQQT